MAVTTKLLVFACVSLLIPYLYLIVEEGRELRVWEQAPSTLTLYNTPEVCVQHYGGDGRLIETTMMTEEARSENSHVLNCGQCGKCSNQHDINIYDETREILTDITTDCVKGGLFRGMNLGYIWQCLKDHSTLTDPCVDCWILNVECNWKYCLNTCIKHKVRPFRWLPSLYSRSHESTMDPCLECDERMCGPPFVKCAGANRRRVGLVSDIQRDIELEVCNKVDWDYIRKTAQSQLQKQADQQSEADEL